MSPLKESLIDSATLGASTFILSAIFSTLIVYGVSRILLGSHTGEDSEPLSARIIGRLGALHGLILALMFAQEIADYRDISRLVSKEASAISDVYTALQEYNAEDSLQSTTALSNLILDYVNTIITADRKWLAQKQQNQQSWLLYQRISEQLANLTHSGSDLDDLQDMMQADWDTVSDFHQRLRAVAEYEAPGFFWFVIISGFLVIVIPCHVYSPKPSNLVTLSAYAAFNGFVMYVIFAMANPFTGPLAIDSHILDNLLVTMEHAAP
jgi:hypothetical protein